MKKSSAKSKFFCKEKCLFTKKVHKIVNIFKPSENIFSSDVFYRYIGDDNFLYTALLNLGVVQFTSSVEIDCSYFATSCKNFFTKIKEYKFCYDGTVVVQIEFPFMSAPDITDVLTILQSVKKFDNVIVIAYSPFLYVKIFRYQCSELIMVFEINTLKEEL